MSEDDMIDWSQIDGLRADVGPAFDDLIPVFLEEMDQAVARLTPGSGPARMEADLHYLKGSALNLGFAAFARLCAAGEAAAARGVAVDAAPIAHSYAVSRAAFLDGLGRRSVA